MYLWSRKSTLIFGSHPQPDQIHNGRGLCSPSALVSDTKQIMKSADDDKAAEMPQWCWILFTAVQKDKPSVAVQTWSIQSNPRGPALTHLM